MLMGCARLLHLNDNIGDSTGKEKDNINHQIFTGKNTWEFGEIKGSGRAGISDTQ
jgi:hypothetical protein